ncbi:hypothetical protein NDU88_012371 [Pleurodeles waltl]|uniref:Uncharacterized protein n=1 Tax=Pleurodeles waltl TaxID=8319 RepID=A0AAV7R4E9_PLEWA|nr:hypothetical protein NDU88_012371 [Pleurodeles waltl]
MFGGRHQPAVVVKRLFARTGSRTGFPASGAAMESPARSAQGEAASQLPGNGQGHTAAPAWRSEEPPEPGMRGRAVPKELGSH